MNEPDSPQTASSPSKSSSASRRPFVGSRPFKIALIVAILLAVYAIFGFLAAPKWIRAAATQAVERSLGMPLGLGEIRLNPFLFTLEVEDISLPDAASAAPPIALDRLYVDFESSSLWHRALVFKEIALGGPFARVIIEPDQSLNLAKLAPAPDPDAPPESDEDATLPAIWIQLFDVADGHVNFADRSRRMTPEKRIEPIEFTLRDFRTDPEGGNAKLDARSADGEGFTWEGRVALSPVSSDGRFSITELKARTIYEFLSEQLPLELTDGTIDLNGSYVFTLDPAMKFTLQLPGVEVNGLALKALDADVPWISIPSIAVEDTEISLHEESVQIARIGIDRPTVDAWLEPDGSLNLLRLAGPQVAESAPAEVPAERPPAAAADVAASDATDTASGEPSIDTTTDPPPDSATTAPATSDTSTDGSDAAAEVPAAGASAWTVDLAEFALNEAAIDFEDRTFTPPNPTRIAPLSITAKGIGLDLAQRIPLDIQATINDRARLKVAGELAPQPLSGDLEVSYEDGSLLVAQPYVSRVAALTVKSGEFDVSGRVALRPEGADEPWVRFEGKVDAANLHTVDNEEQQDLLNFERLAIEGIDFSLGPDQLAIDGVVVTKPFARVIIAPDQTINVVEVFASAPIQEQADDASESDGDAGSDGSPAESEPFPVAISTVEIKGGTLDFSDFFIQPNFQAQIDALNGGISAMSSDPASKAQIDLRGHVISEFSPVSIKGEMNLFSFDRFTDVDMDFRNIDLPVFNPYSGKFAGFAIAKGKLTTELSYLIENRKLDAQHRIVLDQLEWGEPTGSKDAVSIPIKLATALLKDRDGVIELDFPVGGSLDDPSFKIGPVIWQVVRNLLVKIVTAPFAFIGSLFEGAEDAQFVTFAPGSAELATDNAESLASLAQALLERPQLKLDVPVRRMPEIDGPALKSRKYDLEIERATRIATGAADDAPVDFESLAPQQKTEVLSAVYTVLSGTPPSIPEAPPPPEGTSRADAKALEAQHGIEYLEESIRSLITVTDDELQKLAEARAQAVQTTLLGAAAIEPERVFLTAGDKVTVDGEHVKLELGLE